MTTRRLIPTWAALITLLASTIAASFALTGAASLATGLGIAALKAALVLWAFMHLAEDDGLLRVIAVAAFAWLGILFALGGVAYLG